MVAVFVNDMAGYVQLHGQASATDEQSKAAMVIVRKPVIAPAAEDVFVAEVLVLQRCIRDGVLSSLLSRYCVR